MTPATPRYFLRAFLGMALLFASFATQAQEYQSKYERDLQTQTFQYLELKEFESAQRNYDQQVKLVPDNWLCFFDFALAYLNTPKEKVKAVQYFEKSIELSGESMGDMIAEMI